MNKIINDKSDISHNEDDKLLQLLGEASAKLPSDEETDLAWAEFKARHQRKNNNVFIWISAAAVTLFMAFSLSFFLNDIKDNSIRLYTSVESPVNITTIEQGGMIIVSTPPKETTEVILPDGTNVILGANSRLEYSKTFMDNELREVSLSGKARFNVKRDEKKPFRVKSGELQTEVMGTVFDINSYSGNYPSVVLYKGHVRTGNQKERVDLFPGQQAVVNEGKKLDVSTANLDKADSWSKGMFDYDDTSLGEVVKEIGTWYNVSVMAKSASLLETRVHFRFSRTAELKDIVTALNDLRIANITVNEKGMIVDSI